MLHALLQDFRYAGRILRKNPGFTLVAVLVLALGTGGVSTIFSVANGIILQPIPGVTRSSDVVNIDRIRGDGGGSLSASYSYYEQLAAESKTMQGIAAWSLLQMTVSTGGEGVSSLGNIVSGNYFNVLGVHPALGRFFSEEESRVPDKYPVIVLSHEFWRRQFGADSAVVGRSLLANGTTFTVIGVAPPRFAGLYPVLRTDVWVPLMMQREIRRGGDLLSRPGAAWLELFGRLAPNVSRRSAQGELAALTARRTRDASIGEPKRMLQYTSARLTKVSGMPSDASAAVLAFFVVLLAVSGLVLLIASVNVASMLLARAVARRREIAVRIAMGAGRARLIRQLLSESVLLFAMGGMAGIVLAVYGTRLLQRVELPVDMPLSLNLAPDVRVFGVTLFVALVTGIAFGLAPAIQGSRLDIAATLRGDTAGGGRHRSRLRNALVIGQMAVSLLLLTVSGLFVRALERGGKVDPGFDVTHVATTWMNVETSGYDSTRGLALYSALRDRMAHTPGVTAVGYTRMLPLSGNSSGTDITVPGYTPSEPEEGNSFSVLDNLVDEGYFAAMRIPIVSGRVFASSDNAGAQRVAIVNQEFANTIWPGQTALGKTFTLDSASVTIVGVARDAKYSRLNERSAPFMYLPLAQNYRADVNILVRTQGDPASVAAALRSELKTLDPHLPIPTITTLQQATAVALLPQRVAVMVTGVLGFVGLLLAGIGLYGVIAFSTAQRTREIGLRLAIGAHARDIVSLVVGEGMKLVGIGMGIGLALALVATRALKPFLLGLSPLDALTFLAIGAALGATALLASYLPARRAAQLDPVDALRQE